MGCWKEFKKGSFRVRMVERRCMYWLVRMVFRFFLRWVSVTYSGLVSMMRSFIFVIVFVVFFGEEKYIKLNFLLWLFFVII